MQLRTSPAALLANAFSACTHRNMAHLHGCTRVRHFTAYQPLRMLRTSGRSNLLESTKRLELQMSGLALILKPTRLVLYQPEDLTSYFPFRYTDLQVQWAAQSVVGIEAGAVPSLVLQHFPDCRLPAGAPAACVAEGASPPRPPQLHAEVAALECTDRCRRI